MNHKYIFITNNQLSIDVGLYLNYTLTNYKLLYTDPYNYKLKLIYTKTIYILCDQLIGLLINERFLNKLNFPIYNIYFISPAHIYTIYYNMYMYIGIGDFL